MTIAKSIVKPRNWPDFEKLCKKLFGECWGIPNTIKGNGRSGQEQNGVDIYGIPKGETQYWGIQCKGKDEYSNAKIDAQEIDVETEKAKTFEPSLAAFIIATTSNKDAKIEKHVRQRDMESRRAGGFSIQLYCWEDLADLIEENRATFNWWVREKRHKELFDISITFGDGSTETTIRPRYQRISTTYAYDPPSRLNLGGKYELLGRQSVSPLARIDALTRFAIAARKSLSRCKVDIHLTNSGQEVIEDYRLDFWIDGRFDALSTTARVSTYQIGDDTNLSNLNLCLDKKEGSFFYRPFHKQPLTQEDSREFFIYIKPAPLQYSIKIPWKLYARDFTTSGELALHVEPEFDEVEKIETVKDPTLTRTDVEIKEVLVVDESDN